MSNSPMALVKLAQAAINNIATRNHRMSQAQRYPSKPAVQSQFSHHSRKISIRGRLGETATERQPERCWKPERRKDLVSFDAKSLIHMVRLAGIEPTTPWFVAKYSIQLSYSRLTYYYKPFFHAIWWGVTDLNCGPKDYESSALTN